MRSVAVLGATGSIGTQALEIVGANPGLRACALAAASDHADCVAHDSAGAVSVGAVLAGAASDGAVSDGAVPAEVPMAAFGPDGTLIALVTERDAELHSLAVFLP